ncbi:MAG: hypothetical protein ABIH39_00050, partial [Candidatus Margulisiibacteriota bacterium]
MEPENIPKIISEINPVKAKPSFWDRNHRVIILAILLLCCFTLDYYFHYILGIDAVYTHLFFIPIGISAFWYGLRGSLIVSSILAVVHLAIFFPSITIIDITRAANFFINGLVFGLLGMKRLESEKSLQDSYKVLKETKDKLILSEKKEIVLRLASSIVHEVKNPLAI